MDNVLPGLLFLAIAMAIIIIIFLIAREIVCWYWKINRMVELQEEQVALLRKLVGHNATLSQATLRGEDSYEVGPELPAAPTEQ